MNEDDWDEPVILWGRARILIEIDMIRIRAGYWLRPYDQIADRRRWRWQHRTPCGRQVWAGLPATVRDALVAAMPRPHRPGCLAPKKHPGECWP